MNAANVVSVRAPRAVGDGSSVKGAALNPVGVRFGAFELDEANARLLRDGRAVTLAPRPFGLLCALVRRPGSLLTKNTLLDEVWGHQFVSESVLKTAISDVRTALDDDAREPRFIETVCRRGYRFIAPVCAIARTAAVYSAAPVLDIDFAGRPSSRSRSATLPNPRGAGKGDGSGKLAGVYAIRKVDTSKREIGCALPEPVVATLEEVCYAHQLRLQLRARLLRHAAPAAAYSAGAD